MRGFTPWWSNVFIALLAIIVASHFLLEHPVSAFFDWLQDISHDRSAVASLVALGLSADILLPIPSSVLAVWRASQRAKPFRSAERMPLTLKVMTRMAREKRASVHDGRAIQSRGAGAARPTIALPRRPGAHAILSKTF
jgi:hypothetical protein